MGVEIRIEHAGKAYSGEIAKITSTSLGVEDHGILSAFVFTEWQGGGVGVGGYALDAWDEAAKARVTTAYGLDQLVQIMRVVGVSSWEKLPGQQVIVLFDGDNGDGSFGSRAIGLASTIGDRVLDLKVHAEQWKEAMV